MLFKNTILELLRNMIPNSNVSQKIGEKGNHNYLLQQNNLNYKKAHGTEIKFLCPISSKITVILKIF